jgi:phosphoribosylformylglycinamidine synthase I
VSQKIGVVRFLGTNCDRDIYKAVEWAGNKPEWLWYADHFNAKDYDAVIVPGGFSYGDYLRSGALAAKAPVMTDLVKAAGEGLPILGICNGFQILCEAGLLPGALVQNQSLKFVDLWQQLKLENSCRYWGADKLSETSFPIAHGDGRFVIEDDDLKRIQDQGQVWWSYQDSNPNGSMADIAGVMNEQKNVAALMPHPERAMAAWMGSDEGLQVFNPNS